MATKPQTPEDIKEHLDTLTADIKALADAVAGLTRAEAEKLKDEGRNRAEALAKEAGARVHQAEVAVHDHPGMSIAVATGLGFLAGLILGRR